MHTLKRGMLAAALVLFAATGAYAQDNWELNLHAGVVQPDLGIDEGEFEDEDDNTDTDLVAGVRLMKHWANGFGLGANFDWAFLDEIELDPTSEDDDVNVNLYYYSAEVAYTFGANSNLKFSPSIGIGAATTHFDDIPGEDDIFDEGSTDLMIPIGLALKWVNDPVDPTWGFRVDGRDNIVFSEQPSDDADDEEATESKAENTWELTAGVSFFFGGGPSYEEPEIIAPLDSDGDGVTDDRDRCPNTPAGTRVDADGCPIVEEAPACVDGRDWYRADDAIFVDGRNWVKFGAPRTVAMSELSQIDEYDGVPVFRRTSRDEILLPLCSPANTSQTYRPDAANRGTTG